MNKPMRRDFKKIKQVVKLREKNKLTWKEIAKIMDSHIKSVWRLYQYHLGTYPQVDEKTLGLAKKKVLTDVRQ